MVAAGPPEPVTSPTAKVEWNAVLAPHSGSVAVLCHRTAPLGSMAIVPPPGHLFPSAATPLPMNTSVLPVPRTSTAVGVELIGAPVATGQPGSSAPDVASKA